MQNRTVVVTGAGGFIGGHLVSRLLQTGTVQVRAVDIKPFSQWHQVFDAAENLELDCSRLENCRTITKDAWHVYNLACDMGGMGFITNNKALCMLSVLIDTHMLKTSLDNGVERYFYSSSACVYAADKQTDTAVTALREEDAYPAMPEDGYGWEKLFSETHVPSFSGRLRTGLACRPLPQCFRPAWNVGWQPRLRRRGAGVTPVRKLSSKIL